MRRGVVALVCVAVMSPALAGFSLATKYQPQSASGGYAETALAPNVFRVSFVGNGYTAAERAVDFALLRSAEVALEHGYKFFVIIDAKDVSKVSGWRLPLSASTSARSVTTGNVTQGTATTTFSGGQALLFEAPKTVNTIVCFSDRPETQGLVYESEFLSNSIRRKYGLGAGRVISDTVTIFVCGATACDDPRIPRIRELMAEGMLLDDAYTKATAERAGQ